MRLDTGGASSAGLSASVVDVRDPTTDRRLVEFCLAVPAEQYLRNGQSKWLLRRAMAKRLSRDILDARGKGLVGADWYLRVAPHQSRFEQCISGLEQSPGARRCLDLPRMRRLVEAWPAGHWNAPQVECSYRMGLCRGIQMGEFIRWVESGTAAS
jgi:asparagine synthase (glutamine-hydrolysing)